MREEIIKTLTSSSTIFIYMLLFLLAVSGESCKKETPMTKSAYLQSFEALISYTEKHCIDLDDERISTMDAVYEALSQDLYEEFGPQLTPEEHRQIWDYRRRYLSCKTKRKLRDGGQYLFKQVERLLLF